MSKKLKVKYEDFINESLYIRGFDAILKEMAKKNRVATILSFLTNSDTYKDDETINFLNLAPSINMITYIPTNRRTDNIWDSTGKTEMRIGRVVRQILNKLKPEDFRLNYKGKVCFETRELYSDEGNETRTTLIFSEDLTGKSLATQIENGFELISWRPEYDQMSTEITLKIGDNTIKSNIADYSDECYVLQWDGYSNRIFFRIFLDKNYGIGSQEELTTDTRIDDIEECKKFTYDCEIELVTKAAGKSISEINDSDIEQFVNEFMAQMKVIRADEDSKIEMVNGEGIRNWYNSSNYQSTTGQLGGSCMAGNECQSFLDIYVKNPEVVSLLILKNKEGKLIGRSLLWKLDDGKYFMDRVYCATDYDTKLFTKYANDMGYYYRNNGGNNNITIYLNGEVVAPSFSVHIKEYDIEFYPYMDTLKDLDMSGVLSYNSREYDCDRELRDTEGKWVDFYDEDNEIY